MPAASGSSEKRLPGPGDDELVNAVMTASRVLVGVAARSLSGFGDEVTIPQYRALAIVASRGKVRPVDLAETLAISTSTVTRLCDRLERKGLVTRNRDVGDRREVWVELSVAGLQMVEQVTAERRREIGRILTSVAERDRRGMLASFRRFADVAGGIPDSSWSDWEL